MIDIATGFTGFTIDVFGNSVSDSEGDTTKVLFAIPYQERVNDVNFTITDGNDHWSSLMPTGEYIALRNPKVIFSNRDSAIVQFDMDEKYPSNSMAILAYRSMDATFHPTEISREPDEPEAPFVENTIMGHMGFTSNEYGGGTNGEGEVERIVFNISYTSRRNEVNFEISDDDNDWAVLMGDGSYINLINPHVLFNNKDSATVVFQMRTEYPSNSPGFLVRRRKEACFTITEIDEEYPFIPIQNIVFPSYIPAGERINLPSMAVVYPMNSSLRSIEWSIESAGSTGADVQTNWITTTNPGRITLTATVPNGLGINKNYTQNIDVNVIENWIIIQEHPHQKEASVTGQIKESLSVIATTEFGDLSYQWYKSADESNEYGNAIAGATDPIYKLPKGLIPGEYFYFCEVRKVNFPSVRTDVAKVRVRDKLISLSIYPSTASIPPGSIQQFGVDRNPETSDESVPITWRSDKPENISIDNNGLATSHNSGNATITATCGDISASVKITASFVAVTGIVFDMATTIDRGAEYTLPTKVTPSNATNNTIEWTVSNAGSTGATITDGKLMTNNIGNLVIRGKVNNGATHTTPFVQYFNLNVVKGHIPVTEITMQTSADPRVGELVTLRGTCTPANASSNAIVWSIKSAGSTGAVINNGNELTVTNEGNFSVNATVINGKSTNTNFVKSFDLVAYPARVPVTSVEFTIEEWDPHPINGEATELEVTVLPEDATNKSFTIALKDAGDAEVSFDPETNSISCDPNIMTYEMVATATFEITVKDGINQGIDFIAESSIRIKSPVAPDIFVPVTDIELSLPTPTRALYPVLVNRYTIYPWNSNKKDVKFDRERFNEAEGTNSILYNPTAYDFSSDLTSDIFDWNLEEYYLFPWGPGKVRLIGTVIDGDNTDHEDKYCHDYIDYVKEWELEFQDPYLAIKNIDNIPESIPCKQEIILTPFLNTLGGTNFYNPFWDEEIPTYTDLQWRIGSQYFDMNEHPNTANARISGNTLYANNPGTVTIQAYVPNGKKEPIQWYDKEQLGEPYVQLFTINVTEEETEFDNPILTLTLTNGNKVRIKKMSEMTKLCTDLPSNTDINIGSQTFKKSEVSEIKFWDTPEQVPVNPENPDEGYYTPETPNITSLRNFGRNFISLRKIDRIPETVNGDNCLAYFLAGCSSFNQPLTIPEVEGTNCLSYFLKDCINFNSEISFAGKVEGGYCMHAFLYGCSSFNQPINIPNSVTGEGCLERFLMKCTSFNQPISIPSDLFGPCSMRDFLTECTSFNQSITLPDDIGNLSYELNSMMRDCYAMCSTVYVPEKSGNAIVNEQTFACKFRDAPIISEGIQLIGPGAAKLKERMENNTENPMYRNVRL